MFERHPMGTHVARLGIGLPPPTAGAFWMQVYDGIFRRSQTLPVELVNLGIVGPGNSTPPRQQVAFLEDIVAQELDVLIDWPYQESLAYSLLEGGLAIVHLSETAVRHPLSISPVGLGPAAEEVARFLAQRLDGAGDVLVIGGLTQPGLPDDGKSRLAGATRVFDRYPQIRCRHVPSQWDEARATIHIRDGLARLPGPFDAILGLSDPLALLAREIACDLGRCRDDVAVAGLNGDPIAISAILNGDMLATVETSATELGARAVELACSHAFGQACEPHYSYHTRLITADTAASVAAEHLSAFDKLLSIPFNLLERERVEHLAHLETSLTISRQLSTVLDEQELPSILDTLIRDTYGFDHMRLVTWDDTTLEFSVLEPGAGALWQAPAIEAAEIYRDAYATNTLVLVPDQRSSLRYEQDSQRAENRSRVVLPVRCGGQTCCLLDLSADRVVPFSRVHLLGLQALADQVGIALQNARSSRRQHENPTGAGPVVAQAVPGGTVPASVPESLLAQHGAPPRKASLLTGRAVAYVREHYSEPISRSDLAAALGVSENYLTDLFHREMGTSLWTYLNRYRVKQAKQLLVGTELKITEIALRTGFDDPAYFSRVFRRCTGRSPRAFRKLSPSGE
jgi:AraC-like DNA-binding protein/DNA-binding LacI/PurR family transcriptional regulator